MKPTRKPKPQRRAIVIRMDASPEIDRSPRTLKVAAYLLGRWAWHRTHNLWDKPTPNHTWSVTHVPTGMAAFSRLTRLGAERVARVFATHFSETPTDDIARMLRDDPDWRLWVAHLQEGLYRKAPKRAPMEAAV